MASINQQIGIEVAKRFITGIPFGLPVDGDCGVPMLNLPMKAKHVRVPTAVDPYQTGYENGRRDIGGEVRRVNPQWSSSDYELELWSYEIPVSEYDDNLDMTSAIATLEATMRQAFDVQLATLLTTAGNFTSTADAGGDWDGAGTPIADINTAMSTVAGLIGRNPNTIVIPRQVMQALMVNSEFTSAFNNVTTVTEETIINHIGAAWGMKTYVTDFFYEEKDDSTLTDAYGEAVVIFYSEPESPLPSARWAAILHAQGFAQIKTETEYDAQVPRIDDFWLLKALKADAGYRLTNCLA